MLLEGSCHCQAVRFSVESHHPVPYQRCYCSVCRKAGGGGGFAINIEADAKSLKIEGRQHVRIYRAAIERNGRAEQSEHERHFCERCGSHLWAFHPGWPELLHPVATAIDTPLPLPPENVHMMIGSKANWVAVEGTPQDARFEDYPEKSLADWHDERGLTVA